ncbi:MAG: thiolase family protein [Candidatus Poseidoniaceae archaeon]|jgi:acetyl-CoA acyltransferase|nr:thiolase family protein [Candidatus Poseidoniaceae archaeon]
MGAVIADYVRTPFHRAHKGELFQTRPEDLVSALIQEIQVRNNVITNDIEDLLLGCAYPEGVQGLNLGRIATYLSGLPSSIPGMTTNRLCGSSMQVIHTAAGAIGMGSGNLFLCAGVETMSLVKRGGWNRDLHPEIEKNYPDAYISMGLTAENLANKYSISRLEQEEFALHSHDKALSAQKKGFFDNEIVGITVGENKLEVDGCIRDTSIEKMSKLSPAFVETGTVTAATSSPLTDGAACNLLCSEQYADENGLGTLAEIVSTSVVGVPPEIMGIGPVKASKKALVRAGISLDDIDVIELNEAFSAQAIAVTKDLSLDFDDSRINIDGGALAIGHPLGASGARIVGKAASLLNRVNGEYALASMCIGGGMGIATILRRI